MAELVLSFLQDQLASLLWNPLSDLEVAAVKNYQLPPPMMPGNAGLLGTCLEKQSLQDSVIENRVRLFYVVQKYNEPAIV